MNSKDIDDFTPGLLNGYSNLGSTTMEINGFKCTLNMPKAVERSKDGTGNEIAANLPPYAPRMAFKVDEFSASPETWEHGSAKAGSYFVPIVPERGMWIDLTQNAQHTHHIAMVVSIQGLNPITGLKTDPIRLEQYKEKCPVHSKEFKQDLFCSDCKRKWPAQNYLASTSPGTLWLDGFMTEEGVVRQWVFTEEQAKGVAAQVIGKERVHAIGIAFYKSKEPKPPVTRITRGVLLADEGPFNFLGASPTWTNITNVPIRVASAGWNNLSNQVDSDTSSIISFNSSEEKTSGGIPRPRSLSPKRMAASTRSVKVSKTLEIGAGARIDQKIHADPQSIDFWEAEPSGFIYVNYCSVADAKAIIDAGRREEKSEGFLDGLKLAK